MYVKRELHKRIKNFLLCVIKALFFSRFHYDFNKISLVGFTIENMYISTAAAAAARLLYGWVLAITVTNNNNHNKYEMKT